MNFQSIMNVWRSFQNTGSEIEKKNVIICHPQQQRMVHSFITII